SFLAPGTVGTLWAWIAFLALSQWMGEAGWGVTLALAIPLGWWASTVSAQHMNVSDPKSVVIDEVVAFWLVLWLVTPASFIEQVFAFALFRYFDAAKPGPVGWADRLFHAPDGDTQRWTWVKAGAGIMLDDLVAAACTLLVIALVRHL
ncbi:MAG: phosphatidylglycerophosphatase A, partial [Rhodoferax sp.]|nr:phosphatidylglycerophosphatase A [Rhodoferax sp.]